jgi:hypothetical protein
MVPLTGVQWKNQPTMSYFWLGLISWTKIWIFNISVLDSCTEVCHSSTEGLGLTSQRKDIFDFTTLKGDYHLTTSWRCMNNSKGPTFTGSNVLRAHACNGILVPKLTKSSNLTRSKLLLHTYYWPSQMYLNKIYNRALKNCITLHFHPCASILYSTTCF